MIGEMTTSDASDGQWEASCDVVSREQVANELLAIARGNAGRVQTERKYIKESKQSRILLEATSFSKIDSLTLSIVHSLLGLIEQFVANNEVEIDALARYLDQCGIKRHGGDKTIYARVTRCVGRQVGRSLKNKITDNLAGARLLGIRSDNLREALEKGIPTTPEGDIKHGVSALGEAYQSRSNPKSDSGAKDGWNGSELRADESAHASLTLKADAELRRRMSEALEFISSPRHRLLRISVGPGREIRVRRVRRYDNRIVLMIAPHDLRRHRSTRDGKGGTT